MGLIDLVRTRGLERGTGRVGKNKRFTFFELVEDSEGI